MPDKKKEKRVAAVLAGETAFRFERLPAWALPGVLVLLALLFFLPFILSGKMIYGSDMVNGIQSKFFYADYVKTHHALPWWNPYTLSGMPTLDAFFGDMLYPLAVLQFILPVPAALGYKYVVSVMLAGLFMFLFLRGGLALRRDMAFFGALCFMFNTQFISHFFPGHDGKVFVISLLPLSMFALKRLLDTKGCRYAALLSLSIGLCLLTSHVQTTYFSLWGLFFYFVFETVRRFLADKQKGGALLRLLLFSLSVGLGLGIGMVQLLPSYEFTHTYSVRGEDNKTGYAHATSWSIHPEETASLIVPEFCGFSDKEGQRDNGPVYWGRNPFKLNSEYPGIIVLVLSIAFLFLFRRDPFLLFFGGVGLFVLIFALGANTPFFYLFYYLIPGVKLFRAPSMIMFWFSFAAAVMTAYGLHRLLTEPSGLSADKKEAAAKMCLKVLVGLVGLTLIVSLAQGLVRSLWGGIFYAGLSGQKAEAFKDNYPSFIKGAWLALIYGGTTLFLLSRVLRERLRPFVFILFLSLIAILDLFHADAYFYKLGDLDEFVSRHDPLLTTLSKQAENEKFRVFPVPGHLGDNDPALHRLESVTGFHDNEIKWYREFRGGPGNANFLSSLQRGQVEGNPFLDLLNVRYILYRSGRGAPLSLAENRGGRDRAWVTTDYEVLPEEKILSRLSEPGFSYKNTLLLETAPDLPAVKDSAGPLAGRVTHLDDNGNDRTYEVEMTKPGFLMMSEVYMPYWEARDNGRALPVYKTDLALMSVPLTAGKHRVELRYHSPYIRLGAHITFAAAVLVLLLYLTGRFFQGKRKEG
ncbi:MAG: hypothetical protein A2293_01005 [Elusimicrobia bacterium RIFOXYB2_FULL_49_7]|nr:MAG: hypothetical protein A2293_01005 [Elusimicrobia bacterium RIFOXYB2_FULL_49_7]